MAKMKNKEVRFADGPKLVTDQSVTLSWANVNEPDSEYDSYSVEMMLPREEQWVKDYIQTILDFENTNLTEQGQDTVDLPACLLRKGEPRVSDCGGFWMLRAGGKTNLEAYTTKTGKVVQPLMKNRPTVYSALGVKDPDISVWSGDECKVAASMGFYLVSGSYGAKLYLKDVQQIVAGPGPTNASPFGDESESAGNPDVPF